MTTGTLTNSLLDPHGTAVQGVTVTAQVYPLQPAFGADGHELAPYATASADNTGAWSLTLEATTGITPTGTVYQITESWSDPVNGQTRKAVSYVTVLAGQTRTLAASLTVAPASVAATTGQALTLASLTTTGAVTAASVAAAGIVSGEVLDNGGAVINACHPTYGASAGAADNATALQAALNAANTAGGGRVVLAVPGTYLCGATLTIYSNTTLVLGDGVTLKQKSGTNKTMIQNYALTLAAKTATLTASGTTVTAACTAHGLAVGQWVSILWAGTPGYSGVFRVATVADANTFTYTAMYAPTVTPSIVSANAPNSVIEMRPADSAIFIEGPGTIDYDYANNGSAAGVLGHAVRLRHFYNCGTSRSLRSINALKYCIEVAACRRFLSSGNVLATHSDGIHVYGPAFETRISDVSGATDDDGVIMQACESPAFAAFASSEGDIIDYVAQRIAIDSATLMVAVYNGNNSPYLMTGLVIDGVSGFVRGSGVAVAGSSGRLTVVDALTIANVSVTPSGGTSIGTSYATIRALTIRDFNHRPPALTTLAPGISFDANTTIQSLVIDGLRSTLSWAPGSPASLVSVIAPTKSIAVRNGHVLSGAGNNLNAITLAGSFETCTLGAFYQSGGNSIINQTAAGTGSVITVGGVDAVGVSIGIALNVACTLVVDSLRMAGGNAVQFFGNAANQTFTYIGQAPQVSGGANQFNLAGGTNMLVSFQSWGASVDLSSAYVNRATGNYCSNSNAALGSPSAIGTGPVVCYGTSSGSWKSLDPAKAANTY